MRSFARPTHLVMVPIHQLNSASALRCLRIHSAASISSSSAGFLSRSYSTTPLSCFAASSSSSSAGAASSSPLAASSASSASSSHRHLRSAEVLWLYRLFLRHVRALPEEDRRMQAFTDVRSQFRSNRPLSGDDQIGRAIDTAYSKMSFIRMATPRMHHPRIDHVPDYPAARALFDMGGSTSRSFVYTGEGEVLESGSKTAQRSVVNSQGLTDEQFRRHHALVERMNFRGPYWQGKSKY